MADKDTYREYLNDVDTIAEDAKANAEEYGSDVYDNVNEAVGGSYWIVYTNAQLKVLQYTDNKDAINDVYGDTLEGSADTIIMQIAYFAMVQDVMDRL
jgi:hypothetical protein